MYPLQTVEGNKQKRENAKNKIGPQDPKAESVIRLPSIEMSEPAGSP